MLFISLPTQSGNFWTHPRMSTKFWSENLKEKDNSEDLGVDE